MDNPTETMRSVYIYSYMISKNSKAINYFRLILMFKTEITSYTLKHTVVLINCMVLQHMTDRISYFKLKKKGGARKH